MDNRPVINFSKSKNEKEGQSDEELDQDNEATVVRSKTEQGPVREI